MNENELFVITVETASEAIKVGKVADEVEILLAMLMLK